MGWDWRFRNFMGWDGMGLEISKFYGTGWDGIRNIKNVMGWDGMEQGMSRIHGMGQNVLENSWDGMGWILPSRTIVTGK